ncbi:arginine-tRNA ligase [Anaeramoeba ignava]|uniref:arginine--tRNA ligase n=1 Tax=Anaeramoeba ignava TaxID=1746090 RepID=A0A9Q0LSS9_ANAIG|nr:arginine-tRNA ligase [Anaeramoeba ignava]
MEFKTLDLLEEILTKAQEELKPLLLEMYPNEEFPKAEVSRHPEQGDLSIVNSRIAAKLKQNATKFTENVCEHISKKLGERQNPKECVVSSVRAGGPYTNIILNRPLIFKATIKRVLEQGEKYGHTDTKKGQKAIVEHTSANPIAPLHIGNLRNVVIGAHLTKLLQAVGYEVKQRYFVNDLGAQIGLSALGYASVDESLKKLLGVGVQREASQVIGMVYAIMNTFSELEKTGKKPFDCYNELMNKKENLKENENENGNENLTENSSPLTQKENLKENEKENEKEKENLKENEKEKEKENQNPSVDKKNILLEQTPKKYNDPYEEYMDILADLNTREPILVKHLANAMKDVGSIHDASAKLCLQYENNEKEAVLLFRKMTNDCLSGIQKTLDRFDVHHDLFDYESELGWEGSNERVLKEMRKSPYFIEPTQSNQQGVPQGGYLDFERFIRDNGFPVGKKGFQENYPPLYVLRPDGSTLYSYRDVVYSLKKVSTADLVVNVIGSEQILAQEKVALALLLLNPNSKRKQFHMPYELVKLTTGKMSGRRGRYLLADDLYEEIREIIREKMNEKIQKKSLNIKSGDEVEKVSHEVSAAAIRYALLSSSCRNVMKFDVHKVTNFEDASAPFLLYNSTRIESIFRKFEEGVSEQKFQSLAPLDSTDYSKLDDDQEWNLLLTYVIPFASMIRQAACPDIPPIPKLPEFATHRVSEFLNFFVRNFSSYYKRVKILRGDPLCLHPRLRLIQAFKQVFDNALQLLSIKPLERM